MVRSFRNTAPALSSLKLSSGAPVRALKARTASISGNRQALRPIQRDACPPALDELEVLDRAVGPHTTDEAVVVFRRWRPVDVRDEVDVLRRVVQDRFRRGKAGYRQRPGGTGGGRWRR